MTIEQDFVDVLTGIECLTAAHDHHRDEAEAALARIREAWEGEATRAAIQKHNALEVNSVLREVERERDALRAENERLREAMKPMLDYIAGTDLRNMIPPSIWQNYRQALQEVEAGDEAGDPVPGQPKRPASTTTVQEFEGIGKMKRSGDPDALGWVPVCPTCGSDDPAVREMVAFGNGMYDECTNDPFHSDTEEGK